MRDSFFSDNGTIKGRDDFKLPGLIKCKNNKYGIDYSDLVSNLIRTNVECEV